MAGKVVDTGYAKDKLDVTLSVPEARALLAQEPDSQDAKALLQQFDDADVPR